MTSQTQSATKQPPSPPYTGRSRPSSIAPSETPTQYLQEQDDDDNRTPRANSLSSTRAPSLASTLVDDSQRQRYRGFPSEEAYLAALRDWVESKKYIQTDSTMIGYYGTTTMEEYASRPKVEFGLTKRWKERKAKKEARRSSAATATATAAS